MTEPPELESVTFGILSWPDDLPDFTEAELADLQERHVAYLQGLRERGILLAGGPLDDQADERLRGICFYAVGIEEARAAAEQDPSVRAGRLHIDVMTWYHLPGEAAFGA